tara:strand:- start:77 stop:1366 length:1290 start_codon:yes stop_codon:yes gene_type:complete
MATTGASAYRKYFAAKNTIETRMAKDSSLYFVDAPTRPDGKIKKHEIVEYQNEGKYESKALIKYKKKIYRVSFNALMKPVSKAKTTIDVKPQSFGIKEGPKYTTDQLRDVIQDNIIARDDLTPDQKAFLEDLLLWHTDDVGDAELKESFERVKKETTFVNRVKTDFSEALGPFAVISYDLLEKCCNIKYPIARNTKAWFPDLPNYPLMDYAIITGTGKNEKQIVISHKAKPGSTNVVKPKDVLMLLDKQDSVHRKWKNTDQYKILTILDNNPILTGGVEVTGYLVTKFPSLKNKYKGISKNNVSDFLLKGKNYDQKLWTTFIQTNVTIQRLKKENKPAVAGGKVTADAIRYACEKIVEKETVKGSSIPMTAIFVDAIKNQVYYTIFKFGPNGIPIWSLQKDTDFEENDTIFLRTKNSSTKGQDKMGFQP